MKSCRNETVYMLGLTEVKQEKNLEGVVKILPCWKLFIVSSDFYGDSNSN